MQLHSTSGGGRPVKMWFELARSIAHLRRIPAR
jgi:hypothetical protein